LATTNTAVLHVLTTDPQPPTNLIVLDNTIECEDTYLCACLACQLDRMRAVKRGVRSSDSLPIRRRKAA
jgi:hypothetical protein